MEYYWAEKAFLDFGIISNLFILIPASNNQERYNILSQGVEKGLVMASGKGILPLVFFFLQKGAKDYNEALISAARGGHLDIVKLMIRSGAKDYNSALIAAARGGHLEIVKLMIELGAIDFNSAMAAAAEGGYLDIVKLMLSLGAIDFDRTMEAAARGGHLDIVKLMLSLGANPNILYEKYSYVLRFLQPSKKRNRDDMDVDISSKRNKEEDEL